MAIVANMGCFHFVDPDEEYDYDKRIIIKTIKTNGGKVDWYHYSLFTSYSPGFIEFTDSSNKKYLISKSTYISDLEVKSDTLTVVVWKRDFFSLDTTNLHFFVKIDTTGRQKH
jgi:hypothetical protein